MFRRTAVSLLLLIGLAMATQTSANDAEPEYPAPPPPQDTSNWGEHIQRSMKLLATSTPEQRNKVRILFYGQSITRQDWWLDVVADLRERFPHADIEAENLAIGGFSSQRLIYSADMDLYPCYPDLLIFHVFGAHDKYEKIISRTRRYTAAEVVMLNDHLAARQDPAKPDKGWSAFMNDEFLPKTAKKYHCRLLDVRGPWREYLLENGWESQKLLRDGVHLNEHGCWLMGKLVARPLVYRPELPEREWADLVTTYRVGKDVEFEDGRLELNFDGNRVVALAGRSDGPRAKAKVLIDGRPPSDYPALYNFTRANVGPDVDWPWDVGAPFKITSETPPVEEDWTITVTEGGPEEFHFKIAGSVTGPDGEGVSTERFVSDSGRVVIEPGHWWTRTPGEKSSPLKPGYELHFECVLLGTDLYEAPRVEDPALEYPTVLAQGMENEVHDLKLVVEGEGEVPIKAIRVYRPPFRE